MTPTPANDRTETGALAEYPALKALRCLGGQAGAIERLGLIDEAAARLYTLSFYPGGLDAARAEAGAKFEAAIERQGNGKLGSLEVRVVSLVMLNRVMRMVNHRLQGDVARQGGMPEDAPPAPGIDG